MSNKQVSEEGTTLQRRKLILEPENYVQHGDIIFKIKEVLDFESVLGINVETGRSKLLRIHELSLIRDTTSVIADALDIDEFADQDWQIAEQRYAAIKPLLSIPMMGRQDVEARAQEVGVNTATLYRWLRSYKGHGVLSALIPKKRGWKAGHSRIPAFAESIINEVLDDTYLTKQRSSAQKVVIEVKRRCQERGVKSPHPSTIRARINKISEKRQLRSRGYRETAKNKFMPVPGHFPNADYPLAVVQIDHTPVDIILVDDVHRKPIGRPWITLAMDVFSRTVTGYYLAFDPPSETSVAMCVAHSILPKDDWLVLHDVDARWDVWGVMDKIHVDNGADFRSNNFRQSCLMHSINLEFRPVKQPQYGGHIERLLGTLLKEIHELPGTTFSSIKERDEYDSEKHAVMTKSEFETWLVTLISKVYHQRLHSSIGMSPMKKWEIGIFGNAEVTGRGLPSKPADRLSLLLDFLPSFQRTIQTFGVTIDGLSYYSDVLRSWINTRDPENPNKKRLFTFRRDPRDICIVWFYDPELKQYFRVPFANQALPSMSIWEYSQARTRAKKEGMESVNEHQVLQAISELRDQVEQSKARSKKARRMSQRRKEHEKKISPAAPLSGQRNASASSPDADQQLDELSKEVFQPTKDIA